MTLNDEQLRALLEAAGLPLPEARLEADRLAARLRSGALSSDDLAEVLQAVVRGRAADPADAAGGADTVDLGSGASLAMESAASTTALDAARLPTLDEARPGSGEASAPGDEETLPTSAPGTEETLEQRGPPGVGASSAPAPVVDSSALLRPGERVDQYEVIRPLGAGGMGAVYLARDVLLGRRVCLKVVHPHLVSSPGSVERFLFEARATARFSHPNIVTIYGLGQVRGSPFIALEFLPGTSLRARLRDGPLAVGEAVEIARRVAQALEEAHRQGVLHCDLKPENVFLPRDGRLRVLDFGLARLVQQQRLSSAADLPVPEDASGAQASGVRGTTAYMAPEQWQQGTLGPATDLWALGVTLFEMLTGRRPFHGGPVAIYEQVTQPDRPLPSPADLAPHLPPEIVTLCRRCLSRDPTDRPTAREVAEQLAALSPARVHTPAETDESPFRGLLPFRRDHADLFFGRDPEIAACVERLRESSLLAVVGPSGAGKSSFVQAGVIPRLESLGAWESLVVRPGGTPLLALATRLERAADTSSESAPGGDLNADTLRARRELAARLQAEPALLGRMLRERATRAGGNLLLVLDQFEEIFTLARDAEERAACCQALLFAADDPEGPVRVVLTLREDFLSRLALFPEFIAEVSRGIVVIRTPGSESLAETLVEPVRRRGYRFEDDALVPEMVAEVSQEPAGLPLLQFAAARLWEGRDRQRRELRRDTYEAIGGVAGALAEHADQALDALVGDAALAAREVLLRLVTPEGTRTTRQEEELVEEVGPGGRTAVDHLVAARLLVSRRAVSGDRPVTELELVHESLINRWARLRRWLEESQEDLRLRAELEVAVQQWRRRGEREEDLWRGRALAEALDWRERQGPGLPAAVVAFVTTSEAVARRHSARRTQLKAGAVALALLIAVGLVAFLRVRQQEQRARQAHHEADVARTEARARLAAALLEGAQAARLRGELAEARAKLRASFEVSDSVGARALFQALRTQPLRFRARHPESVFSVAVSPDGLTVATGTYDGAIRLWDWATGTVRVLRGHRKEVFDLSFDPTGRFLASGAGDGNVRLWPLETGRSRLLSGHLDRVYAVAFDPTGRRLASASGDGVIKIWPLGGGAPRTLRGHAGRVNDLQFGPAGRRLFSAGDDRTVRIWDLDAGTQRELRGHLEAVTALACDPGGAKIASASEDGTVRIWDLDRQTQQVLVGHEGAVTALAFDPRGGRLASGGTDRTLRLWSLADSTHRILAEHGDRVSALSWGGTGGLLASGSYDRTAQLWDVQAPPPPRATGHRGWVSGVAFRPGGEELASASQDRTVRLWNLRTGASRTLRGHTARVIAVIYRPDGEELASAAFDQTIRLWDLQTGRSRVLRGHTARIYNLSYAPDGKRLVSASWDRTLRLWDLVTGEVRVLTGHEDRVFGVDFSPDGGRVVSGGWDRTVRVWDLATGKNRILGAHRNRVSSVAWAPNGKLVASVGYDRALILWDLENNTHRVLRGHTDYVWGVAISPDSRTVATASRDRSIRLWDVASGKTTAVLKGHRMDVNRVAFSPRAPLLASGSDDTTVRLWELPSGRPRWRAPALLGRGEPRLVTWRGLLPQAAFGDPTAPTARPRDPAEARLVRKLDSVLGAVNVSRDAKRVAMVDPPDHVQLWSATTGALLWQRPWKGVEALVALPRGVAGLARGKATYVPDGADGAAGATAKTKPVTLVSQGARRVLRSGEHLLVATRRAVHLFDDRGRARGSFAVDPGLTAALLTPRLLIVGHRDGTVEAIPREAGHTRAPHRPFEDVPATPVTQLVAGPMETLGIGFRDGTVGLWNVRTGKLLERRRLHGPLRHLRLTTRQLLAATELGDTAAVDLSIFHRRSCAILREIWRRFPATWDRGRAVRRVAPVGHRCRTAKAQ